MNGMVWLSTVRSSSLAARCKVSEERTPHATVCIVLRPTLAGAGDYKELRRISPLSTIRIADVYRKAPCRKYNARRFKSQASSPPQRLRARWTTFRRPAGRGHACGAVAPKSAWRVG